MLMLPMLAALGRTAEALQPADTMATTASDESTARNRFTIRRS